MRTTRPPIWLKRLALFIICWASTASAASAQSAHGGGPALESTLVPGTTVWITDRAGREEKTRIVDLSGDTVTTRTDDSTRRFRTADIARVSARRSDSVLNGALIGAGAAVASGLLLCRATEPWENCRDDYGPMLRIGAIGAGIGAGIDALIRGRKTIYEADPGTARVQASPLIGRRGAGLQVSVSF